MHGHQPPHCSDPPPQNLLPAIFGETQQAPKTHTMTAGHIDALIVGADQAGIAMSEPPR